MPVALLGDRPPLFFAGRTAQCLQPSEPEKQILLNGEPVEVETEIEVNSILSQ
jgi:hypothetical protein